MTCPADFQTKYTDQYDAEVWRPTITTTGAGARAFEASPDSGSPNKNVMVLKAPSVAAGVKSSYEMVYAIQRATIGQEMTTFEQETAFDELRGYHKLAIATPTSAIPTGSGVQFVKAEGDDQVPFNLQIRNNAGSVVLGGFVLGHNLNSVFNTAVTIPYDEEFEVRWHWKKSAGSDGLFRVDVKKQGGDWVTARNVSNHTGTGEDIERIRLNVALAGTWANNTYDIEVAHVEWGLNTEDDWGSIDSGYADFKACFPIDASDTTAKIAVLNVSPDRYKNGTHYRINYGTTEALGTTTARTTLAAWNPASSSYMAQFADLTGLAANTVYYWRVEIGTGASTTLTSPTYSFKTMQAAGSASPKLIHIGSCSGNDGKVHPLVGYKSLAENVADRIDFAFHTGDTFYEAGRSRDPNTYAPETEAEYLVFYKEVFEDRYRPTLLHSTVWTPHPGDHAFWNDIDGDDQDNNVGLIKNDATVGSNYNPTSTATYQDVWTAAKNMWDAWFADGYGNNPAGFYQYRDCGNLRYIQLDGVTFRDKGAGVFFGTTQIDWLKARCAEMPVNSTVIISSDTAWGPINRQADSVHNIAPNETRGFNEWAETPGNVADGVKIIIIEGDTHRGWWAGKAFYDTGGNLMADTSVLAFNALFSPMAQAHTVPTVATDATEIASFTISGYASGDLLTTSGGVLNLSQSSARLRAWGDDAQELDTSISIRATTGGGLLRRNHYFIGQGMGLGL